MADPQRLISNCGNEIRKLADTEKHIQASMTDLRSSMTRLDTFTQRADDKQWSDLDKVRLLFKLLDTHLSIPADVLRFSSTRKSKKSASTPPCSSLQRSKVGHLYLVCPYTVALIILSLPFHAR